MWSHSAFWGHLGLLTFWFKFCGEKKINVVCTHTLMYFHGTCTQLSFGRVTHLSQQCGVKGHLGVIDLLGYLSNITIIVKAGKTSGLRTAL